MVILERRYGPRRLRDDDDDDEFVTVYNQIKIINQITNEIILLILRRQSESKSKTRTRFLIQQKYLFATTILLRCLLGDVDRSTRVIFTVLRVCLNKTAFCSHENLSREAA